MKRSTPPLRAEKQGAHAPRSPKARLAWTAIAFVGCQLALGLTIALLRPDWRDPRYGFVEAELRRRHTDDKALVVMLGSSRSHSGFHGAVLEGPLGARLGRKVTVANFAVSGGGPFSELLTLRRLLHDGHRPDLVLVDITPPFMNTAEPFDEIKPDRLPSGRLRPVDVPLVAKYRGSSLIEESSQWMLAWSVPSVTFRTEILDSLWPSSVPEKLKEPNADRHGWLRLPTNQSRPEDQFARENATRQIYGKGLESFQIGGPNWTALRELLATLKSEQVPAVLVLTCESPEFQTLYRPGSDADIACRLSELEREFAVPVVDARDWFSRESFMDLHHLHPDAAARFTERLCAEGIEPQLKPAVLAEHASRALRR